MGLLDFVLLLLNVGADMEAMDKDGITALSGAVEYGHADVAKMLVERGAFKETKDQVSGRPRAAHARPTPPPCPCPPSSPPPPPPSTARRR